MENAAKALEIAAGVLLAVMIMSLIAFFMQQLGVWPKEQEKQETAEQLAKFNQEYTVYQKKGMYGVDVISCLNKAKSNNEKYAETKGFFTGTKYETEREDNNYYIDVYVNLNSNLKESLEIYYLNSEGRRVQSFDTAMSTGVTMKDALFKFTSNYTDFKETDELKVRAEPELTDSSKYMVADGGSHSFEIEGTSKKYYSLRGDERLADILNFSGENMKQIVTNTNKETYNVWLQAVWSTALYDFKTKRFKCDYIGYSSVTGRVNKIYFSEL